MSGSDSRQPRGEAAAPRLRLHVENSRRMPPVFWITPERYEEAARRHPEVAAGLDVTIGFDLERFDEAMQSAEVLVGSRFPTRDLGSRAPRLRWIQLAGAGLDHLLPLDWLPRGVRLSNNSGVHAPKAAEYACMAILMLNSGIPAYVTQQRHAQWERRFSSPVAGKSLLVVGVGDLGGAAAERAKQLGMRVLGVRRSRRPHRHVDEMFGPEALDDLLPRADVVLLTTPLTSQTRGLIGRPQLERMKPGAGLVNMARGALLDTAALVERLSQGTLGGAVLDVFDPEPLPADSPLWRAPNLLITPHVSSDDPEQYVPRTLDLLLDNVARYRAGKRLRNSVQTSREY